MTAQALPPLRLSGAALRRQGKLIAGPLDLTIEGTGLTIIMGPNGSGKTSLLRMLHGLEKLSQGSLSWPGREGNLHAWQGFVFQAPVMLRRNVLANLTYPLRLQRVGRAEAGKRALDWLGRVGLEDTATRPARALSGGERQKLALARALIRKPEILLLDEPCASLDGAATRAIEDILLSVRNEGTRIVMATHDMGQARRLADDILFIVNGRIHEAGKAADFFAAPKTPEARAFLQGDIVE